MNNTERIRRIEAIYASLPKIACKQFCQESCGPISASRLELKRIGGLPHVDPQTLNCSLLDPDGLCTVYSIRPLVCRIWACCPEMKPRALD